MTSPRPTPDAYVANKGNFKGQGPFAPARLLADAQVEDPP